MTADWGIDGLADRAAILAELEELCGPMLRALDEWGCVPSMAQVETMASPFIVEILRLRRWQAEATAVLAGWDRVAELAPAALGELAWEGVARALRSRADDPGGDMVIRAARDALAIAAGAKGRVLTGLEQAVVENAAEDLARYLAQATTTKDSSDA